MKKAAVKDVATEFITEQIMLEKEMDSDGKLSIPSSVNSLLKDSFSRNVLITELVNARKNFSGSTADTLQQLYEQLQLNKDSQSKLKSFSWHVRAKGIQELSQMQQKEHWKSIYRLTDNRNEYVRMEAQAAIIRLLGFVGLRFLTVATYPITEWQQVNLLRLLEQFPAEDFRGIEKWLLSPNYSVVEFALKLVSVFRRYDMHDLVVKQLQHPRASVRLQAVKTLGDIYGEETHHSIIAQYANETIDFQRQALRALGKISSAEAVPFLLEQTRSEIHNIKLDAYRALWLSTTEAKSLLVNQAAGNETSLSILAQIEYEMTA